MDRVFKALASPARRRLLDSLRAHDGESLRELCTHLDMTRQGVAGHLRRLEGAKLVSSIRRGREKLFYLNPVPIHEIFECWIKKYERPQRAAC
jgi:DNA-binding transcriptional ArsR family regulator